MDPDLCARDDESSLASCRLKEQTHNLGEITRANDDRRPQFASLHVPDPCGREVTSQSTDSE